ncbi:GntR family transcriptional regulator [bacterium]|nr:GntR family transcriptional regulator [bacterium]
MAIDYTSKMPLYRQIIEDIKRRIGAGHLKTGDQIASNAELARVYDVSMITVKKAIADLIKDGYLYGRVGRGTFVADPAQFAMPASAGNLGFVLTNFSNPFFTGVLHHIESRALDFGYRLLVSYAGNNIEKEEDQIRHFKDLGVKGVIVASTEQPNQVPDAVFELHQAGFPYVMISYVEDPSIYYVGTDHEQGAYLATEYLIQCGCRQPGILCAEPGNPLGKLRRKGFMKALKSYHVAFRPEFEFHFEVCGMDFQSGYRIGRHFSGLKQRPDGVFAFNDHSAVGFERALTESGLRIPQDAALVGFDDVEFDVPPPVSLTTVRQPAEEIALQALIILNHQIEGHATPLRKILKPRLVVRDSCNKMSNHHIPEDSD